MPRIDFQPLIFAFLGLNDRSFSHPALFIRIGNKPYVPKVVKLEGRGMRSITRPLPPSQRLCCVAEDLLLWVIRERGIHQIGSASIIIDAQQEHCELCCERRPYRSYHYHLAVGQRIVFVSQLGMHHLVQHAHGQRIPLGTPWPSPTPTK